MLTLESVVERSRHPVASKIARAVTEAGPDGAVRVTVVPAPQPSTVVSVRTSAPAARASSTWRRAYLGPDETRRGVRIVRSLALRSLRLGLTGKADVVEFPLSGESPMPVEYKRGKPKLDRCDEVQLCAQALCMEEMLGVTVAGGALYYGTPRRRMEVKFDNGLRAETEELARRMQILFRQRATPARPGPP